MNVPPYKAARDGEQLLAWVDAAMQEGMPCFVAWEGSIKVAMIPWATDLVVYALHPNQKVRASLAIQGSLMAVDQLERGVDREIGDDD